MMRASPARTTTTPPACCTTGRTEGILVTDARPALYVYEQGMPGRRTGLLQRGLIGAVRLTPPDASGRAAARGRDARAGRRAAALMEATQANLEPIFLLYDGDGAGRERRGGLAGRRGRGQRTGSRCSTADTATASGTGCGR